MALAGGALCTWGHASSDDARVGTGAVVKVLIAGGSFAGLEPMLALRVLARDRAAVELAPFLAENLDLAAGGKG